MCTRSNGALRSSVAFRCRNYASGEERSELDGRQRRDLTSVAGVSMLPHMSNTPIARLDDLLSSPARTGRGGPAAPTRPVVNALYEFGGGFPDPASFPYDGIVEATARMIKVEGAEALTYGDHQGYRGLRELVCEKYQLFEGMHVRPES